MTQYHGGAPYVPSPTPDRAEDLPRYLRTEFSRLSSILADLGKVAWGGEYVIGNCYDKGTQIQDQGWTMIANKDTCDRPAPQPIGIPQWTLPDSPVWNSKSIDAATLSTGQRYVYPEFYFITSLRVWLPVASENTYYRVLTVADPDGPSPQIRILADWFTTTTIGWNILGLGQKPIAKDSVIEIILQTQNRTGLTQFAGNYDYSTPGNTSAPDNGEITHDNQHWDLIQISKTDFDGNPMGTDLATLIPGDELTGAGRTWTIQSVVDNTSYFSFTVIPASQGSPDGIQPFNFTHYADQPVPFVDITDHWLTHANIDGVYEAQVNAPAVQVLNDNAYGTDIEWQNAEVSEDWDFVSAP